MGRGQDVSLGADARVHDGQVYRAAWEIRVAAANPESGFRRPLCRDIVRQVDHLRFREALRDDALHYAHKWSLVAEIRCDRDDA